MKPEAQKKIDAVRMTLDTDSNGLKIVPTEHIRFSIEDWDGSILTFDLMLDQAKEFAERIIQRVDGSLPAGFDLAWAALRWNMESPRHDPVA